MLGNLYLAGIGLAWSSGIYLLLLRRPRENKLKDSLVQAWEFIASSEQDAIFYSVGIRLTMAKYKMVRNIMLCAFLLIGVATYFSAGIVKTIYVLCAGAFVHILSWPGEARGKTPFKIVLERLGKNYKQKKDDELMTVIMQLKNIIVAQGDNPWGIDYIMQSIMRFTKITKPIFANTISLMRLGKEKEAYQYFGDALGTKLGHQFSSIVLKMDYLNPSEFMDQLVIFQNEIIEARKTSQNKKLEIMGVIMFSLASFEVLLVVANFIMMVINYSIGQMAM